MRDITADNLQRQSMAAADLIASLQSDDAELLHDMTEGETDLFEAIDRALDEIDECEIVVTGCKAKEEQIGERRLKAAKRQDRIRGLIEQAIVLAGLDTVKRPCATLTVRKIKPKAIITDEALIPADYWRQPDPVLDRTKINADASDTGIPGITMSNGTTALTIRRV